MGLGDVCRTSKIKDRIHDTLVYFHKDSGSERSISARLNKAHQEICR